MKIVDFLNSQQQKVFQVSRVTFATKGQWDKMLGDIIVAYL